MTEIRIAAWQERNTVLKQYPHTKQVIRKHLKDSYTVIAVEHGEILGFAFVFRRKIPAPVNGYEDFINGIEVFDAANRGKGIASAILKKCIETARANGSYQLRAYCSIQNAASHHLWFKNRFGIAPVKTADGRIDGSFVTYIL